MNCECGCAARYIDARGALTCGTCPLRNQVDSVRLTDVPELLALVRAYVRSTTASDVAVTKAFSGSVRVLLGKDVTPPALARLSVEGVGTYARALDRLSGTHVTLRAVATPRARLTLTELVALARVVPSATYVVLCPDPVQSDRVKEVLYRLPRSPYTTSPDGVEFLYDRGSVIRVRRVAPLGPIDGVTLLGVVGGNFSSLVDRYHGFVDRFDVGEEDAFFAPRTGTTRMWLSRDEAHTGADTATLWNTLPKLTRGVWHTPRVGTHMTITDCEERFGMVPEYGTVVGVLV